MTIKEQIEKEATGPGDPILNFAAVPEGESFCIADLKALAASHTALLSIAIEIVQRYHREGGEVPQDFRRLAVIVSEAEKL